jgi:chemotaxis protein methyltransferase CheR
MSPQTPSLRREFAYTQEDFLYIKELVYKVSGISLSDVKKDMVYSRLARRLRALKINTFSDYCRYLDTHQRDELTHAINAITTNLTHFFREHHHFETLEKEILPELQKLKPRGNRLRIWSAGCSTGEEPYSIAMTVTEAIPQIKSWDAKILATDLDSNVVAHCIEGVYDERRIEPVDKKHVSKWFTVLPDNPKKVKVKPELASLITFKQLNLMDAWPIRGPFDVIFCRNVVIYFDKPTQQKLFKRFYDMLAPNGYLFLGHSEQLGPFQANFESLGRTTFRKKG